MVRQHQAAAPLMPLRVLGFDALQIGLAFLPVPVLIGALSLGSAERLNTRFGPKPVLIAGLAIAAAGLFAFSLAGADGSYLPDVFPAFVLLGLGAGLAFPAMVGLAMSGARPDDAGLASGLVNTTQQVGGALGLALLATLSATRHDDAVSVGLGQVAAATVLQSAPAVAEGIDAEPEATPVYG